MIARIFIALFVVCFGTGSVLAQCGAIPNVLTNGQPPDANQVMGNFNFLRDCLNTNEAIRRNVLLNTALLGKLNAGYIRDVNAFADGYKATDGISSITGSSCSGLSSNCTISVAQGDVTPTSGSMVIVTTPQVTTTAVSHARVLIEYNPVTPPIILNDDLKAEVTCDNGANWAWATLSPVGTAQGARLVAETADTPCGVNGTLFAARITSANAKLMQIFRTTVTVH